MKTSNAELAEIYEMCKEKQSFYKGALDPNDPMHEVDGYNPSAFDLPHLKLWTGLTTKIRKEMDKRNLLNKDVLGLVVEEFGNKQARKSYSKLEKILKGGDK